MWAPPLTAASHLAAKSPWAPVITRVYISCLFMDFSEVHSQSNDPPNVWSVQSSPNKEVKRTKSMM